MMFLFNILIRVSHSKYDFYIVDEPKKQMYEGRGGVFHSVCLFLSLSVAIYLSQSFHIYLSIYLSISVYSYLAS